MTALAVWAMVEATSGDLSIASIALSTFRNRLFPGLLVIASRLFYRGDCHSSPAGVPVPQTKKRKSSGGGPFCALGLLSRTSRSRFVPSTLFERWSSFRVSLFGGHLSIRPSFREADREACESTSRQRVD